MVNRSEILKKFFGYFDGKADLSRLRRDLVSIDIANSADPDAQKLLSDFEGLYAEFSDGLLSEEALRANLKRVVSGQDSPWVVETEGQVVQEPSRSEAVIPEIVPDILYQQ